MKRKALRFLSLCMAMVMMLSIIPVAANAAIPDNIAAGQSKKIVIDQPGGYIELYFTPAETAVYVIYSSDNVRDDGERWDTYGHLYLDGEEIGSNDDGTEYNNFLITAELTAGKQYVIRARAYSSITTGTMKVNLFKQVKATGLEAFHDMDTLTLSQGQSFYASVDFKPVHGKIEDVTFTSSKPSVVEYVDGRFVMKNAGTATLTAVSESGLKDTIKITVLKAKEITVGSKIEVSSFNFPVASYKFVAPKNATYVFSIENGDGFYAGVCGEDMHPFAYSDSADDIRILPFDAQKGKTYYFPMEVYPGEDTATIRLMEATSNPGIKTEQKEYIGFVGGYVYPDIYPDPINSAVNIRDFSLKSSNPEIAKEDDHSIDCLTPGTVTVTAILDDGPSTTFKLTIPEPTKLTKTGDYKAPLSSKQQGISYTFTPSVTGKYFIDLYNTSEGALYMNIGREEDDSYNLTAGETYSFYVVGSYGREHGFYILKDTPPICLTKGHNFVYSEGIAPTTMTIGYTEKKCSVCGVEDWSNPDKLKGGKAPEKQFKDVKKKDWFYDAVDFAYNSNLFNGTSKTEFAPNDNMTRGMFVTVLGRMAGVPADKKATTKFADVPKGQYYTPYVKWANDAGIVNGVSATKFAPDDNVTREQICVMMVGFMKNIGIAVRNDFTKVKFGDEAKLSKWAKNEVLICQQGGIVNGIKSGKGYVFNPQGNATRAEVATILHNFAKNYLSVAFNDTYFAY